MKQREHFLSDFDRKELAAKHKKVAQKVYFPMDERGKRKYFLGDTRLFLDSGVNAVHLQDIDTIHNTNFLTVVIPEIIQRVRAEGSARKIRILDLGGGTGLSNDQIRTKFPDDVRVFSTSLLKGKLVKDRKQEFIENIRQGILDVGIGIKNEISLTELSRREILASLGRDTDTPPRLLHPDEAKWRSILELSDWPEFDLIIDTLGELLYVDSYIEFRQKLAACVAKLRPGGRLYISVTKHERTIDRQTSLLENKLGIKIRNNRSGLIIEKPLVNSILP